MKYSLYFLTFCVLFLGRSVTAFANHLALFDSTQTNASFPWVLMAGVMATGALGGLVNALNSDNGFIMWKKDQTSSGQKIVRPGVLANIGIGVTAALLVWFLNTDFDALDPAKPHLNLIAKSLGSGIIAGVGGARVITNAIDKQLLRAAASEAASAKSSPAAATQINTASPGQALEIARSISAK
jgi:hypothetical protein